MIYLTEINYENITLQTSDLFNDANSSTFLRFGHTAIVLNNCLSKFSWSEDLLNVIECAKENTLSEQMAVPYR